MRRISSNIQHTDSNYAIRKQESRLHKLNNSIQSQRKIQTLRDDPLAAGHSVRYKSFLARLERFEKNAKTLQDQYSVAESSINSTLEIMHRIRTLAVQNANGVYQASDLQKAANEVDELLKELIQIGNASTADGVRVFAGAKSFTEPFEAVWGNVYGADESVITDVRYVGALGAKVVETDEQNYVLADNVGNRIFWAERQSLFSEVDAKDYIVPFDSVIGIDGVDISLTEGDNIYAIVSKINDSGAPIKAHLDPVTNGLSLVTVDAHQIWLQDGEGASILSDLGLIKEEGEAPYNIANSARVSGGSLFDAVIAMRDALFAGDQETLGGKVLGAIDGSIDTITTRMTELGARYSRAEAVLARLSNQTLNVTQAESREADLDFTKAISDLKMYEFIHSASLSVLGNLYKSSLLNHLK